jgi:hypothetical protein
MVILAIALVAGLFGLYKLLPFIITLLKNGITALVLGAVMLILLFVVTSKRFWTLTRYIFKSISRAIAGIYTTIDPIGILKNYISDLRDNAADMDKQVRNLRGQMQSLKNLITENDRKKEDALKLADRAKKNSENTFVLRAARKAGRLEQSNMTLQGLYTKLEILYRVLYKMYQTCGIMIDDLEDEVGVKEREHKAIMASYSAFKSAMRIISGDAEKKELFDQTMEFLTEDYGRKLGEIEHFMEISSGFMEGIDLQNGIYEEEALRKLEAWEKQSDSLLLGDEKQLLLSQAHDPENTLDLSNGKDPGYLKLFKEPD